MIIGFPRMVTIPGFERDFSPVLISSLAKNTKTKILLETKYGSELNYKKNQYVSERVEFVDRNTIFKTADLIVALCAPPDSDILNIKRGSILLSMLHFSTHPSRNAIFKKIGIRVVSLDILFDYEGNRLVQDLKNTAWNGVNVGFTQLISKLGKDWWYDRNRDPITAIILGFGGVGKYAAEAILHLGDKERLSDLIVKKGNPIVNIIPLVSLHTKNKNQLPRLINSISLKKKGYPHLLLDATRRKDCTKPIFSKDVLSLLPPETIIVDLTADNYDNQSIVKGIPGFPTGSEKQWIFDTDDKVWNDARLIPRKFQIAPPLRRTVVSNYAWPSYGNVGNRQRNMEKYATQIYPVILSIVESNLGLNKTKSELWNLNTAILDSSLDNY